MTERAQTVLVRFQTRKFFPLDAPLSVPLLRLMAAANDVRSVQKSTLMAMENLHSANQVEQPLLEGELGYLTRMLFGHLHEAGIAFRDLDDRHAADLDRAVARNDDARREVDVLRRMYRDTSEGGLNKYLEAMRSPWVFHYKFERFKEALEKHPDEATIVLSEYAGVGRYTITDDFAKRYMLEKAGSIEAYQQFIGAAIDLAGKLARAVDLLLGELALQRGVELAKIEGEVRVPEQLTRSRDRVRGQG